MLQTLSSQVLCNTVGKHQHGNTYGDKNPQQPEEKQPRGK